jgi:hypothetical protein
VQVVSEATNVAAFTALDRMHPPSARCGLTLRKIKTKVAPCRS